MVTIEQFHHIGSGMLVHCDGTHFGQLCASCCRHFQGGDGGIDKLSTLSLRQRRALGGEGLGIQHDTTNNRRLNWINHFCNKFNIGFSSPPRPMMHPITMHKLMMSSIIHMTTTLTTTTKVTTSSIIGHSIVFCYPDMYEWTGQCNANPKPWMILPPNIQNWKFVDNQACSMAMEFNCAEPPTMTTMSTSSSGTTTAIHCLLLPRNCTPSCSQVYHENIQQCLSLIVLQCVIIHPC